MNNILIILFTHLILDYVFQSSFIATNKGSNTFILLVHSLLYGLGMGLLFTVMGVYSNYKVFILVVSHMAIDQTKCDAKDKSKALTTHLYIDQFLHMLLNIVLYLN